MARLPALLILGVLSGIRLSAADTGPKPGQVDETTLTVTTGYGVSGLVLWLAADSGVTLDNNNGANVAALADKTGNFILTPPDKDLEPTYVPNGLNGRPVLRFNGNQALYSPDNFGPALDHDMTIIIVGMTTGSSDRQQFPIYLGQNSQPHVNRSLAYFRGKEMFDGQYVTFFGEPVVTKAFVILGASVNSTLTQATFYRNGKQIMASNLSTENGDAKFENPSDGVTMGAATDPVRNWVGDIAEELVYDRQLTPAEMQAVGSLLSNKYGIH
jgi:hypothetical protein